MGCINYEHMRGGVSNTEFFGDKRYFILYGVPYRRQI